MKQRRSLLKAALLGGVAAAGQQLYAAGAKPLPAGVRKVTGEAFINGARATEGQVVVDGDTLVTGPKGEMVYVIGTNAYLLRENSQVSHTVSDAVAVLRVVTGKVLAVFGPGAKRIEVPTATLGIRGTGCYIEAAQEQVYFCLCYGEADIVPAADATQARSIVTRRHDSPFFIGKDPSKPLLVAAPVINHTDLELTMLELQVGRKPPFTKESGGY
jgi:hypothetical protein